LINYVVSAIDVLSSTKILVTGAMLTTLYSIKISFGR
jgi:hypothetical protein